MGDLDLVILNASRYESTESAGADPALTLSNPVPPNLGAAISDLLIIR